MVFAQSFWLLEISCFELIICPSRRCIIRVEDSKFCLYSGSFVVEEVRSLMALKREESELLLLTLMKSMNMRMSVPWKDCKTESFS